MVLFSALFLFSITRTAGSETLITVSTDRKSYHFTHLIKINGTVSPLVAGKDTVQVKIYNGVDGKLLWDFPKTPLRLSSNGTFSGSLSFSKLPPKAGQETYILEIIYLGSIGRTNFDVYNRTLAFTVRSDKEKYTAKIINGTLAGYTVYDGPDKEANLDFSNGVVRTKMITKGTLFDKNGNVVFARTPSGENIPTTKSKVKDLRIGNSILKGNYSVQDFTIANGTLWLTMGEHVYVYGTVKDITEDKEVSIIIFKAGVSVDTPLAIESASILYSVWALANAKIDPNTLSYLTEESVNAIDPGDPRTNEGVYAIVASYNKERVTAQFRVSFKGEDTVLKPEDLEKIENNVQETGTPKTDVPEKDVMVEPPVQIKRPPPYEIWAIVLLVTVAVIILATIVYAEIRSR